MKINLTLNGKNFYDPVFTFLYNNEKTEFLLGIHHNKDRDYNFIRDNLLNNFIKFDIKETSFLYETGENIYVFNLLERFNMLPYNKAFDHGIVLLNENGKIIEQEYRTFNMTIYEDSN